jgi:hypothetical protein
MIELGSDSELLRLHACGTLPCVHQRAAANGKRVQCNLGAKNHAVSKCPGLCSRVTSGVIIRVGRDARLTEVDWTSSMFTCTGSKVHARRHSRAYMSQLHNFMSDLLSGAIPLLWLLAALGAVMPDADVDSTVKALAGGWLHGVVSASRNQATRHMLARVHCILPSTWDGTMMHQPRASTGGDKTHPRLHSCCLQRQAPCAVLTPAQPLLCDIFRCRVWCGWAEVHGHLSSRVCGGDRPMGRAPGGGS